MTATSSVAIYPHLEHLRRPPLGIVKDLHFGQKTDFLLKMSIILTNLFCYGSDIFLYQSASHFSVEKDFVANIYLP